MTSPKRKRCSRFQRSLRNLISPDPLPINRDLFLHSLPLTRPRDIKDIFDLILQVILLLLEEWKPDDNDEPDDVETRFPKLAGQANNLAHKLVQHPILRNMAVPLAARIHRSVKMLRLDSPSNLRLSREYIRVQNHHALGIDAHYFSEWNDALRRILDEEATHHVLATLDDYLDAWTQIAKGLEKIK